MTRHQWPDGSCVQLYRSDNPSLILSLFISLRSDTYSWENQNKKNEKSFIEMNLWASIFNESRKLWKGWTRRNIISHSNLRLLWCWKAIESPGLTRDTTQTIFLNRGCYRLKLPTEVFQGWNPREQPLLSYN